MNRSIVFVAALVLAGLTACGTATPDEGIVVSPPADPPSQGRVVAEGIPEADWDPVMTNQVDAYLQLGGVSNIDDELADPRTLPDRADQLRSGRPFLVKEGCGHVTALPADRRDVLLVQVADRYCH